MNLRVEYAKPGSLRPDPANPRWISDEALRRLADLLDAHGFVDPVIARRRDRMIVAGHQRLRANALRRSPDERVPVIFLDDLPDARAKALNVALNNPAAQGAFEMPRLAELLEGLDDDELDLPAATGFDLERIAALTDPPDPDDDDRAGLGESFQVVVECDSEAQQREVYERMTGQGHRCRLLIM